jgi:hypothetical protein
MIVAENGRGRWKTAGPWLVVVVGLITWLWPIGAGGKMPVGGDVTQFSIGLMAELGRSLRSGRIPFWNDLWGYGFPGLAESQMGVFYPPHVVLYGLLPVEWGYTASLVLHTLWAGLGAAWAARRFGGSGRAAALAGVAWGTSGFFLIHLPHQWGATTASWMPWAWGLAWTAARGAGGRRTSLLLAAVLTLQVLPGHFQLAFVTQVTAALIAACGLIASRAGGRRVLSVSLAMAGVIPLGLAQLAPTAELAGLAKSQRSVEYLSAFASPPTHLVSYVAPGLFHQSPLWRPLAWDAFHAMPEEHLATIGLVPLFLAIVAIRGWRDPVVRTLALIALVATCLSLGPYLPGFATYAQLPGFSFFRAPARWGSAAMLALAILAGLGLDRLPALPRPGRSLRRFVLIAGSLPLILVGLFELALLATEPAGGRPVHPHLAEVLDRTFRLLPWPKEPSLTARMIEARLPSNDPRVPVAQARQGRPFALPADRTLARRRGLIYVEELGPTFALLGALFALSFLAGKGRWFEVGLLIIVATEAGYWSRQRSFDLGPIRPLTEQSGVLNRLAGLPRGTRSIDPARNLSMVAGVAPLSAYRTLDLPAMSDLTNLAERPVSNDQVIEALRATGVGVRVDETIAADLAGSYRGWECLGDVDDSTLLGWLNGDDLVRLMGGRAPTTFSIWRPTSEPARAWFVSTRLDSLPATGEPNPVLAAMATARPLPWRAVRPDDVTIEFDATKAGSVVVSQLDYPRWRATLNGHPVPIARTFDGWQGVDVPGLGHWSLRLVYDTRRDQACIAVSGLAWLAWGLLYWTSRPKVPGRVEEESR